MILLAFAIILIAIWGFGARSPYVQDHWTIHLLLFPAALLLIAYLRGLRRERVEPRQMPPHHQRENSCLFREDKGDSA